jgi:glycosyltransferase involved in cell wall biosynthesis
MRIIHCLRAPVGGLFRHVLDLARAQAALGHQVGLIADGLAADPLTEQRLAGLAPHLELGIMRIPMHRQPSLGDWRAIGAVAAHARDLQINVLHGHGAKGGAYARLAARSAKAKGLAVRAYYTPHGGSLNYKPASLEGRVFLALEGLLEGMTDGLIFESAYAARMFNARVGTGRSPRRIVHNGLNPSDFVTHVPNPDAADVLFIGELRDIKGVDILIQALAELKKTRAIPVRAVIVGSGPQDASLRASAAALGLGSSITFAGAMPASAALPLGRTLVVPSRKESLPYVVLEAAAAGMPLISTDVGGICEIVAGTDTPLIAPDDVPALVAAISAAVDTPELLAARARRLQTVVAERFTVARMTAAILDVYGHCAGGPPAEKRPSAVASVQV